jgi:hypothetical protein
MFGSAQQPKIFRPGRHGADIFLKTQQFGEGPPKMASRITDRHLPSSIIYFRKALPAAAFGLSENPRL